MISNTDLTSNTVIPNTSITNTNTNTNITDTNTVVSRFCEVLNFVN